MQMIPSLQRLIWKEFRMQRDLWLAVLGLTIFIQVIVAAVNLMMPSSNVVAAAYVIIALVATCVYYLGCGATLFAIEHELGTFDFQRVLPVRAWHVYAVKIGVGVISGLALLGALLFWTESVFVGWRSTIHPRDWLAGGVSMGEVFVWAVFFSLLIRHPLPASVCAIVTPSVLLGLVFPLADSFVRSEDIWETHRQFLSYRAWFVLLLLAIDTWLAIRWFEGRLRLPFRLPTWSGKTARYSLVWQEPILLGGPTRRHGWRPLLFVGWRQGRWILLLLGGLSIWTFVADWLSRPTSRVDQSGLLAVLVNLIAMICGNCAFSLEQWSRQYRFHAERGVSPRVLWLARHLLWLPLSLILSVVAILMHGSVPPTAPHLERFVWQGGLLVFVLAIYGCSQLAAMRIPSILVSMVTSVFALALFLIWLQVVEAGGLPISWTILPIPVVTLAASYWLVRDWLVERRGWRHWFLFSSFLAVPTLAVLTGSAIYRAVQIPAVDPGVEISEYTRRLTPSELETLRLYQSADQLLTERWPQASISNLTSLPEATAQWRESMESVVSLFEQAHESTPVPVTLVAPAPPAAGPLGSYHAHGFFRVLRAEAAADIGDGKLDEAWHDFEMAFELLRRLRLRATPQVLFQSYAEELSLLNDIASWGTAPGQTHELTSKALKKLDRMAELDQDNYRIFVRSNYVTLTLALQGDENAEKSYGKSEINYLRTLGKYMPWELTRSRRLLNVLTREALQLNLRQMPDANRWLSTTALPGNYLHSFQITHLVATRQATRIRLALADYRREHDQLPESLSQLVPQYFPSVPNDAHSNRPFLYHPQGLDHDLMPSGNPEEVLLPKQTAFLWSPGYTAIIAYHRPDGSLELRYTNGTQISLEEGLSHGLIWPINR